MLPALAGLGAVVGGLWYYYGGTIAAWLRFGVVAPGVGAILAGLGGFFAGVGAAICGVSYAIVTAIETFRNMWTGNAKTDTTTENMILLSVTTITAIIATTTLVFVCIKRRA